MKQVFENLIKKKFFFFAVILILVLLTGGYLAYQNFTSQKDEVIVGEVGVSFDSEGPYAQLFPRRDGNAVILNLKRTSSYDQISYELAYTSLPDEILSGGVDRGVMGEVRTDKKKGEYEQEILFGTCSKNVCKYDKGVENGTLTLRIKKNNQVYRMVTQWRLQKPDVALGKLQSGDGHFSYNLNASKAELILIGYTIINDLTGLPKLPEGKQVVGKVYALNVPIAKGFLPGEVKIELAQAPDPGANIARYDFSSNSWKEYDTKITGSILTSFADGSGIFAVLSPK